MGLGQEIFESRSLGHAVSFPPPPLSSALEQITSVERGKWTPLDPSPKEKPDVQPFQNLVRNPKCWSSERQLSIWSGWRGVRGIAVEPGPPPPQMPPLLPTPLLVFTPKSVPSLHCLLPPPLFLPFFLTAGTNFIYTSREPSAELRFLDSASCSSAPSAQDGGRLDPPARAPA